MRFKKTLLAMMIFGATAAQADYQFEGSVLLGQSSEDIETENPFGADYEDDKDVDSLDIGLTVYFSPVSTANGPLAEAAFISKASEISIDILHDEVEFEEDDGYTDKYDIDRNVISGQFVLPNPALIFRAALGQGENGAIDVDVFALGFGGYINDRIALTLDFIQEDYDFEDSEESVDSLVLTYKQLIDLGNGYSLAVEPYLASIDYFDQDAAKVGVDVTWYITRQLGLSVGLSGLSIEADDGDASEGESRIGVDYFVNENFRIGGALTSVSSEFDDDEEGYDVEGEGNGFELTVAARF
jgi:hypothetical protein